MWLFDWLKASWNWVLTGIGFGNLIAIIFMVVKIIANAKETKLNNKNLAKFSTDLASLVSTKESVDGNTQSNINLVERVQNLENELIVNNRRIGAILDVMGIVYMRSKDEDVRTAVANVISSVQYRDTKEVETLKLTVADLKEKLTSALVEITELKSKQEPVTNVAHGDVEVEEIVLRG